MNKDQGLRIARRISGIALLPLLCLFLMLIISSSLGASLFVGGISSNVPSFFKSICYFALLCFAVSINLHTGRMGFDVGAILVLSTVVGFIVGIRTGDNIPLALLSAILVGMALNTLSGALYIALRLPMMIVSLGTTLIYEAIAYWLVRLFAYRGNVEAIQLNKAATPLLCAFGYRIRLMIGIALLATLFMTVVFRYTRFGYDYRALQSGQKIAVSTGIREKKNALLCYLIAGALLGVAGIINFSYAYAVQPSINFGTVPIMFECFCPLFFGGFINRFCDKQAAILFGVLSYSFLQIGLGQIRIVQNWNNYVIPLINAAILLLFMILQSNGNRMMAAFRLPFRRRETRTMTGNQIRP